MNVLYIFFRRVCVYHQYAEVKNTKWTFEWIRHSTFNGLRENSIAKKCSLKNKIISLPVSPHFLSLTNTCSIWTVNQYNYTPSHIHFNSPPQSRSQPCSVSLILSFVLLLDVLFIFLILLLQNFLMPPRKCFSAQKLCKQQQTSGFILILSFSFNICLLASPFFWLLVYNWNFIKITFWF